MDKFVRITVIGKLGNTAERVFNSRYIKAIDEEEGTVLLEGNKKPFRITSESMVGLLKVLGV